MAWTVTYPVADSRPCSDPESDTLKFQEQFIFRICSSGPTAQFFHIAGYCKDTQHPKPDLNLRHAFNDDNHCDLTAMASDTAVILVRAGKKTAEQKKKRYNDQQTDERSGIGGKAFLDSSS